jgi:hypothetical protein
MIGMDNKLKSFEPPAYMKTSDTALTNMQNNITAGAKGAGRAAAQKMAGRGMSSGRGQQARADRAQQTADVEGAIKSGQAGMKAASADAAMANAYDTGVKQSMLGSSGMLDGLRSQGSGFESAYGQASNAMTGLGNNAYTRDWQSQINPDTNKILRHLMG